MSEKNTEKLLYPDSVAVIGASQKPGIGRSIVANILKDHFAGAVYAVNVRGDDVLSAKGYKSVAEIAEPVDLAVIAVPAAAVPEVVESCGRKGVRGILCISAGFKEKGGDGTAAQEKISEIVNRHNMRMIGPNCMGMMNSKISLNATILSQSIAGGNVALVAQSGGIGAAMLDYAEELGIGFSFLISLGNQADINVCDLLPFFNKDENTRVIAMYLETIPDPRRFWQEALQVQKPILLLKSGRTPVGMAAASSHTGNLAGNDKIAGALIRKAGITRVNSMEELFLVTAALSNMPPVNGNRIGLITNAGGPGILIGDVLSNNEFTFPAPSDKLKSFLKENLMKEASILNPVDIVAPASVDQWKLAVKAMLDSGEYDALPVCCIPPATIDTATIAEALLPILKNAKIPVLTCFMGPNLGKAGREIMVKNGIPAVQYPEHLAVMLMGMAMPPRHAFTEEKKVLETALPETALNEGRSILAASAKNQYLPIQQAHTLLRLSGIQTAKNRILKNAEEAVAAELSFPVAAKIEHPEIVHKSDAGGVRLNIASPEELAATTADFLERFPGASGVYVQEQVPDGLELIAGGIHDPELGSAVMVGLGGIWVEVMNDAVFGYPPISRAEAQDMIKRLRCKPLLDGFRGMPAVNPDALADLLEKLSSLLLAFPEISEIDLNPVIYNTERDIFMPADIRIKK